MHLAARPGILGAMFAVVRFQLAGGFALAVLASVTIFGSLLVSYTRSRAETLGVDCKVGIITRLERVVVTILMLVLNPVYPDVPILIGLGLMAVFTNITVIMRIVHVRREMDRRGI